MLRGQRRPAGDVAPGARSPGTALRMRPQTRVQTAGRECWRDSVGLVIVDDQTRGEGEARARTIDLISEQLSRIDLIVYPDPRSSLDRRLS